MRTLDRNVSLSSTAPLLVLLLACSTSADSEVATTDAPDARGCDPLPFEDPRLSAAVDAALEREQVLPHRLTTLRVAGRGLTSLAGIECLPNLRELDAQGNALSTLPPLHALEHLEVLRLDNNRIHEPAVARLPALSQLSLNNNGVTTLSDITALPALRTLELQGGALDECTDLARFPELTVLRLSDNALSDLECLKPLTELRVLLARGNAVTDLGPLSTLTRLQELSLADNQVQDLLPLAPLQALARLNVAANAVRDLSPLPELGALQSLDVSGNPLDCGAAAPTLAALAAQDVEVASDCPR